MEFVMLPVWFAAVLYTGLCAIVLILTALLIKKDEHIERLTRAMTRKAYGKKAADEAEAYEYRTTFIGNVKRWGDDV